MKDTETRLAFIKARAEGKSYRAIEAELGISKATCSNWEQSYRQDIQAMKREKTEELYTAYNMTREARIKALGDMLAKIDTAIAEKPLEELPADKLLELRLKYSKALRAEYIEPVEAVDTDNTLDGLIEQYNQLYEESRQGLYNPSDIKAQLSILDAKRDTLFKLSDEQDKEESSGDLFKLDNAYTSRLIRHEEEEKRREA